MKTIEEVKDWVNSIAKEYSGSQLKLSELLCDRFSHEPKRIALYYEDLSGKKSKYTYAELKEMSEKFATVLFNIGIKKGDKVATLLPKVPELFIAVLAIWRIGAVHLPLFTAFGPQAISYRLEASEAKLIITSPEKRSAVEEATTKMDNVVVTSATEKSHSDVSFWDALNSAEPIVKSSMLTGDDPFILIFTSGTTGQPKGVEVPVKALASFETYMRLALDVQEEDAYWNMADPGWGYGLWYGIVGTLLIGKENIFFNAPFSAESALRILKDYQVTNFTGAPTAFRALRNAGIPQDIKKNLHLRVLSTAGETLGFELVKWSRKELGVPIRDNYGQTEGAMMVCNHAFRLLDNELRPNSMGVPMPGFRMVVLDETHQELPPSEEGVMAVDTHSSPLFWFQGYFKELERTKEKFSKDKRYYITGDVVTRDKDNFFYFSSRADDIILTAGYRVGPSEIEDVLIQHDAVFDAVVVGKSDPLRGEIVKAFVEINPKYYPSDELSKELSEFVKKNYSAHAYPREVEFIESIPKTPSGKKQRFLLKQ